MGRNENVFKAVTLKDVAKAADVSLITASRALRTPDIVSEEARARVREAVSVLGYAPNQAAQALASARTSTIGVLIPSVSNLVFTQVMQGIFDAVEGTRYRVQLGNTRYVNRKEEELLRLFAAQKPAGLIVPGTDQSQAARALLESFSCPVVQIMDIGPDPVDMMIGFDHREGGRAAVRHLLEKGYRRIGFIGARMDLRAQKRLEGYRAVLEEEGLLDENLIYTSPQPSSVIRGGEMFSDFLALAPDADAVFCNNDDIALGALFECQRRHIRVPGQIGIMGFNDLGYAAASCPSLSSIRTLRYEMGRQAVEMVIAASMGKRSEHNTVDLGFELMARQSTDRKRTRKR